MFASGTNDLVGSSGLWTIRNGTGELLLSFLESAILPREIAIIFSFTLQNPSGSSEYSCPPANISVEAIGNDILNAQSRFPSGRPKVMAHDTVFVHVAGIEIYVEGTLRISN